MTTTKSGIHSRNKGARGELEVVAAFERHGFTAHRIPMSGGGYIPGDIAVEELPKLHVESKRAETWKIHQWIEQARSQAPAGSAWMLTCRRNRQPAVAVVDLEWLLTVLEDRG